MIDQYMPAIGFLSGAAIGVGGMWLVHIVRYGVVYTDLGHTKNDLANVNNNIAKLSADYDLMCKNHAADKAELQKFRDRASALGRAGRAAQIARDKKAKAHTLAALGNTPMRPRAEVVVSVPRTAAERKAARDEGHGGITPARGANGQFIRARPGLPIIPETKSGVVVAA